MDLQELSRRSGIGGRRLRYVLDHGLVPGLRIEIAEGEVGRRRKFADDVGVGIACAAHLVELGLSHDTIRLFLGALARLHIGEKLLLRCIFERHGDLPRGELGCVAELGDGVNVRVRVPDPINYDSKWHAPDNPAPLSSEYRPTTRIVLDLGRILDQVLND